MEKKILFPQIGGFVHGGDYNPEQWLDRPDILEEDIRLMKKAGINSATLGVFSWSVYEPEEGRFEFDWMEKIMDNLYENGIYTILATPSGARPAWLDEAYPEVMRVGRDQVRNHHGLRHNHCMSSMVYREKVESLNRKLARRFGGHKGLLMWHISNEFGGACYCPLCVKRFQDYLAEKFEHDIDRLNHAWWNTFWSHRYNRFEQIEPPYANGETGIMGLNLEWKRFTTWNMSDYMKSEIRLLKELTPHIPITTNFMKLYNGLDYHKMAKELDVISWDSYPRFHNDGETLYETMLESAFDHAVMRSMKKDRPFMLMESAPGLVNWQPYNKLKRPGVHKLFCLQALACGSDTVQYFQWRKGRGGAEQYHGAVVDHLGREDTRIFKETALAGGLLKKLKGAAGTIVKAKTAVLFDWDNRWAIQDMRALSKEARNYEGTVCGIWKVLAKMGVEADVISQEDNLEDYGVILAPMLYLLKPGTGERLKEFVKKGGQLLATYLTGYVDENQLCFLGGFPGDGLSELFGVVSEEIDTLYPGDRNRIEFLDKTAAQVKDCAEILRITDAQVLGSYQEDFYQDTPAVTRKQYGQGSAYYVAARTAPEDLWPVLAGMLKAAGIETYMLPEGVECHVRLGEEKRYAFYLNWSGETKMIEGVNGINLCTGDVVTGTLRLEALNGGVIQF